MRPAPTEAVEFKQSHAPAGPAATAPPDLTRRQTGTRRYELIQALRAFAALMVVMLHATLTVIDRVPGMTPANAWIFDVGRAGVDIFFPISGFVMIITAAKLWHSPRAHWEFMARRVVRIVPAYWLLTTFKLAVTLAAPATFIHYAFMPGPAIMSYLFLPAYDVAGNFFPVLSVGWTLNFEMFFYVVLAIAIFLRTNVTLFVTLVLGAVSLAALFRSPGWTAAGYYFACPIALEFVAGVLIGAAARRGWRAGPGWAWAMAVLAVAWLAALQVGGFELGPGGEPADALGNAVQIGKRVLLFGVPGALLVAAAVSLNDEFDLRPWWPVTLLGDASYAIYLAHIFVTPPWGVLVVKLGFTGTTAAALIAVGGVIASAACGAIIYKLFEEPVLRWGNRAVRRHLAG